MQSCLFFFFFKKTHIPALNFPENQSPSGTCVFKTNFFDHDIFVYFKSKILNKRQQIKVTIELNKIISFLKCIQFHRVFPINSCSELSSPVRDNKAEQMQCGEKIFLRCFDTVFQRPYRYFAIALKVFFSSSDWHKIFTSNWLWIEIGENVVLSKIDITMTTINKNL